MIDKFLIPILVSFASMLIGAAITWFSQRRVALFYKIIPDLLPPQGGQYRYTIVFTNVGRKMAQNLDISIQTKVGVAINQPIHKISIPSITPVVQPQTQPDKLKTTLAQFPRRCEFVLGFSTPCATEDMLDVSMLDSKGNTGTKQTVQNQSKMKFVDKVGTVLLYSVVALLFFLAGVISWKTSELEQSMCNQYFRSQIGDIFYEQGRYDEALKNYRSAFTFTGKYTNPAILLRFARVASQQGKFDHVKAYFKVIEESEFSNALLMVEGDPGFAKFFADQAGKDWLDAYKKKQKP